MSFQNRNRASTKLTQKSQLRVDPKVVISSHILELQRFELESAIQQELNDNPALERIETHEEVIEEESLKNYGVQFKASQFEDYDYSGSDPSDNEYVFDWVEAIPSPVSLSDHLLAQLLPMVPKEQHSIARMIVDSVLPNGYLSMPIEEIANTLEVELDSALEILKLLQTCDPPGVAAHNLRECLQLQLKFAEKDLELLAKNIVDNFWDDLIIKRVNGIVRKYHVAPALVEKAFQQIAQLSPYPGEQFAASSPCNKVQPIGSVSPDILFRRSESGWDIEIRGCDASEFFINAWYRKKYKESKDKPAMDEEGKHVSIFVKRASGFIQAIKQRNLTMRKIANYLLHEQSGFIMTGSLQFLKPMTRVQVAKETGLHESTVSRATMGKFVQIANGEVLPFETFFKPALRIQKLIEEILKNENPSRPLSDRTISEMLKDRGVDVARRTVNKYREQIKHLSSHQRRSA